MVYTVHSSIYMLYCGFWWSGLTAFFLLTCLFFWENRRCDNNQQITISHFGEHKRLHLESSKQNYYIISLRAIIKAIFFFLWSNKSSINQCQSFCPLCTSFRHSLFVSVSPYSIFYISLPFHDYCSVSLSIPFLISLSFFLVLSISLSLSPSLSLSGSFQLQWSTQLLRMFVLKCIWDSFSLGL